MSHSTTSIDAVNGWRAAELDECPPFGLDDSHVRTVAVPDEHPTPNELDEMAADLARLEEENELDALAETMRNAEATYRTRYGVDRCRVTRTHTLATGTDMRSSWTVYMHRGDIIAFGDSQELDRAAALAWDDLGRKLERRDADRAFFAAAAVA